MIKKVLIVNKLNVMNEKMKAKWIKQMFAVVLLGVAAKLLVKIFL